MLRNYVRVALRALRKNPIPAAVNMLGLSLAIASAIVVYLFLERALMMDRFHADGERIFVVNNIIDRGGDRQLWGDSPMPLGPAMEEQMPLVEGTVRYNWGGGVFRVGDLVFSENIQYVDPEFLRMFSFDLRHGNEAALDRPGTIVLSDRIATKYFGEENPIGRQVSVEFSDALTEEFVVAAVAEPFPTKASFTFSSLLRFDVQRSIGRDPDDWSAYTDATFFRVGDPASAQAVLAGLEQFLGPQNAASKDWSIAEYRIQPLYRMARASIDVRGGIANGTHPTAVIVLGIVAVFLLALSCFNYINLAVANASRRMKEIGVRKVVGGSRQQLVAQFMSENIVLCVIALGLGFALAWTFFIPGFNALFSFVGGEIRLAEADSLGLVLFLTVLLVLTGLLSGAYPAWHVSTFQPSEIIRGHRPGGRGSWLTRGLLSLQFVLAFLTMIMGVILAQNAAYQNEKDWGYDKDHKIIVRVGSGDEYERIRGEIVNLPNVEAVVGARHAFARSWNRPVLTVDGEQMESVRFEVGPGYVEQYGLPLLSGESLGDAAPEGGGSDILISELFATSRGWTPESALDRSVRQDSLTFTVIGVVADFQYSSFYDPMEPAFLRLADPDEFRYLTVDVSEDAGTQTMEAIRGIWKEVFPAREFTGYFQDQVHERLFRENNNIKKLFSFIAGLALLIACLGLFGLAVQNVVRRTREISIRKVLGASVAQIARTVNAGFLVLIGVAFVIAAPLGFLLMRMLLNSVYPDPVPIGPTAFLLSFSLVFVAALVTISTQVTRLTANSPADVLRAT
ncbi:MAG: FtsX-like permease family protein [Rhodothermales bacterium]|nr:FtsX-like permease family protein [Rhodothermales bacterium]